MTERVSPRSANRKGGLDAQKGGSSARIWGGGGRDFITETEGKRGGGEVALAGKGRRQAGRLLPATNGARKEGNCVNEMISLASWQPTLLTDFYNFISRPGLANHLSHSINFVGVKVARRVFEKSSSLAKIGWDFAEWIRTRGPRRGGKRDIEQAGPVGRHRHFEGRTGPNPKSNKCCSPKGLGGRALRSARESPVRRVPEAGSRTEAAPS